VNPGVDVPDLLCYENCPDASTGDSGPNMESCHAWGEPSCYRGLPTRLDKYPWVFDRGDCILDSGESSAISSLPSYTLTGISASEGDVQPQLQVNWASEDLGDGTFRWTLQTVDVLDPGMNCDPDGVVTMTFDDSDDCTSVPEVELYCYEGNDVIDFRMAHAYTFDDQTGRMTDTASGAEAVIEGNANYDDEWSAVWFGPFFPDSDDKENLACDYDENLVCSWKAWSELNEMYWYDSGPGAQRVSLVDESGESIYFGTTMMLLYTHPDTGSNSGRDYEGSTSFLMYEGPGMLFGFPQFCLNPTTGEASDVCYPAGSDASTITGDDIGISEGAVLRDSDGNEYFAKAGRVQEIYPVTQNPEICENILIESFDLEPSTIDDVYTEPSHADDSYPDAQTKELYYLSQGVPVVFGGVTKLEREQAAAAAATDEGA